MPTLKQNKKLKGNSTNNKMNAQTIIESSQILYSGAVLSSFRRSKFMFSLYKSLFLLQVINDDRH